MIDSEVERLRRLRAVALRTRAVARALAAGRAGTGDPVLVLGRGIAWRVARTVTGRLRAHPYAPFQRGASFGVILSNALTARSVAWTTGSRTVALRRFAGELRALARELDDARALAWAAELSEALGRSQAEVRALLTALQESPGIKLGMKPVAAVNGAGEADWPFLAF